MMKNETIYHIENLKIVNVPKDITKITQKTRVSIYYLRSLLSHEQVYLSLKREINSKYQLLAEKYLDNFEQLESMLYYKDEEQRLKNEDFNEILKEYVLLKEKVDELQLDMIQEMSDIALKTIDEILIVKKLNQYLIQVRASLLSNLAFNHSHKEDKLDTYLFLQEGQKYSNKKPFDFYNKIKVRNFEYLLERNRGNLQYIFNKLISIILQVKEEERRRELESLNLKQYEFNRQVTIISWVVGVCTIIMLVIAIFQYING